MDSVFQKSRVEALKFTTDEMNQHLLNNLHDLNHTSEQLPKHTPL